MSTTDSACGVVEPILEWYDGHSRDLPWRRDDTTPWGVLVSEVMLQQTPVVRVLPAYDAWMARWPKPADLAAEPPGEAVRMWGRLGYPRRALRLHLIARTVVAKNDGDIPSDHDALRALPGVGDYTAAAVASFAFGQRHAVLDTNVRRVLARIDTGIEFPPNHLTKAERERAEAVIPKENPAAWAVAVMELGALVCTASDPRCATCPVAQNCSWLAQGKPPHAGPPRKAQTYAGTDRQCRGALLAVLRNAHDAVARAQLDAAWSDVEQRERALRSLLDDGLAVSDGERFALP